MALLLDHCVQEPIYNKIKSWGYEVSRVRDHIDPRADDLDVLALAQALDAALLTVDMDFSDIRHFPPETYAGIIVFRYQAQNESAVMDVLQVALEDLYRDELRGSLVVVTHLNYRIRPQSPTG